MKRLLCLLSFTIIAFLSGPLWAQGRIISVSFNNGALTQSDSADVCGVVPEDNWNNVTNNDGTGLEASGIALVDGDGAATSAVLAYKAGFSTWNNNDWRNQSAGDYKMMEGWFGNKADDNGHFTFSNLPAEFVTAGYDVYIYYESNRHDRNMKFTVDGVDNYGAENSIFTGTFTEASGTSYANATEGNYLVFEDVDLSTLVITADADAESGRAACTGIQIVTVPEPATLVMLTLGGIATLYRRRR